MKIITRTVIVPSVQLTRRKFQILCEIEDVYSKMLNELVDYASRELIKSHISLRKKKYNEYRKKYPYLPSHYIYTVCQDVATRVKSLFEKKVDEYEHELIELIKEYFSDLKKEEWQRIRNEIRKIARFSVEIEFRNGYLKPRIRKVCIWLDDHLWKMNGYTCISITTHKGWINIPLRPHKLFWKYVNSGWRIKSQPRIKLDKKSRIVYVYFVFEKIVQEYEPRGYIPVDVNENNETVIIDDLAIKFVTLLKKLTLRYEKIRQKIQKENMFEVNDKKYPIHYVWRKKMRNLRERKRKLDWRRKIAKIIVNEAKIRQDAIVVEGLPKYCPNEMIKDISDPKLRHRIYQSAFKGFIKTIEQIAEKEGVPVIKVDHKYTSSTCPICGFYPMTRLAGRVMSCPSCGFSHDRDVIACLNLLKKLNFSEPGVCRSPEPMIPCLKVLVVPMKAWAEANSLQGILNKLKQT